MTTYFHIYFWSFTCIKLKWHIMRGMAYNCSQECLTTLWQVGTMFQNIKVLRTSMEVRKNWLQYMSSYKNHYKLLYSAFICFVFLMTRTHFSHMKSLMSHRASTPQNTVMVEQGFKGIIHNYIFPLFIHTRDEACWRWQF